MCIVSTVNGREAVGGAVDEERFEVERWKAKPQCEFEEFLLREEPSWIVAKLFLSASFDFALTPSLPSNTRTHVYHGKALILMGEEKDGRSTSPLQKAIPSAVRARLSRLATKAITTRFGSPSVALQTPF